MITGEKIPDLIRIAGLVAGFVILQQMVAKSLFGLTFEWAAMPQLILANFGIVAAWFYFKNPNRKFPPFTVAIAAFCCAIGLRAVLIYLGVFRFVAAPVISFMEKQYQVVLSIITTPQFFPAMIAALILLMLLPKARTLYRRMISN